MNLPCDTVGPNTFMDLRRRLSITNPESGHEYEINPHYEGIPNIIVYPGTLAIGTAPMNYHNIDAYTQRHLPSDKVECPYCGTYQGKERPNCMQCGGPLKRGKHG